MSRYVLEKSAWVRIMCQGMWTSLADWESVLDKFGPDGGGKVNMADISYWDDLVEEIKKPYVSDMEITTAATTILLN